MKAHFVIGCGYGDEGKGITTDFLCSSLIKPIVVRFSGGQQAGHTVRIEDKIHTHSNFGAGSLRGVDTYFSEHTTMYPVTRMREEAILSSKIGKLPEIYYHPLCMVTTPFDRYMNMRCEKTKAHGTCGLGVGKTIARNLESPIKMYVTDLLNEEVYINKLTVIADYYNIDTASMGEWLIAELKSFNTAIENIKLNIVSYEYLKNFNNIIFEGSQGILLDMDHGNYPFVTYANTTSKNAQEICNKLKIPNNLDYRTVYHVTRAYSTRHGQGFFLESPITLKNNSDENNVFNEWQKEFKVAQLNYDMLNYALAVENTYSDMCGKILVVTCNDQVEEEFDFSKVYLKHNIILKSYSSESKSIIEHKK